jgi:hypothetical protein
MSAADLLPTIEKVRTARAAVRALGAKHKCRAEQFAKCRSALALAESELREHGKRLGVCITVIDAEPEERGQVVCARTLAGYTPEE